MTLLKVTQPKGGGLELGSVHLTHCEEGLQQAPLPPHPIPTPTHMFLHGLKAPLFTVTQLATVHLEGVGEETAVAVPSLLPLSEGPPQARHTPVPTST